MYWVLAGIFATRRKTNGAASVTTPKQLRAALNSSQRSCIHPLKIGPFQFANNLALAPMAGVTDRVYRQLCRRFGAGLAASEMTSADPRLQNTTKSRLRRDYFGEPKPHVVQIAGGDPQMVAAAAQQHVDDGAQIIDINMGCPAKKVCRKAAGSALLKDERLVADILEKTVKAVSVPVTLKTRIGWSPDNINGIQIARIAEQSGIQALAIHGRTRADKFSGNVNYKVIRKMKAAISIPVFVNGDIKTPQDALIALRATHADGIMIGRAALGRPWIFEEILHFFATGKMLYTKGLPSIRVVRDIILDHLYGLYSLYGEQRGIKIARKHLNWYCASYGKQAAQLKAAFMVTESACQQIDLVKDRFEDALQLSLAA
ncbi:MAG: tRNA dihydrouridine synthase DusB [Gammaproteobacteria bacterium]|nr:tRNA dihydrouridine synthase DusB [Gammaproteobacteria bacterium]